MAALVTAVPSLPTKWLVQPARWTSWEAMQFLYHDLFSTMLDRAGVDMGSIGSSIPIGVNMPLTITNDCASCRTIPPPPPPPPGTVCLNLCTVLSMSPDDLSAVAQTFRYALISSGPGACSPVAVDNLSMTAMADYLARTFSTRTLPVKSLWHMWGSPWETCPAFGEMCLRAISGPCRFMNDSSLGRLTASLKLFLHLRLAEYLPDNARFEFYEISVQTSIVIPAFPGLAVGWSDFIHAPIPVWSTWLSNTPTPFGGTIPPETVYTALHQAFTQSADRMLTAVRNAPYQNSTILDYCCPLA